MMESGHERQVATTLEDIRKDHRERYAWAIARMGSPKLVLDAGCGVGYGSNMLSEQAENVIGIDISPESIEYANSYWKNDKITFAVQDLHKLDLDDGLVFDTVVAFESIEHLASPELLFLGLRPRITRETKIFLSSPNQAVIPHRIEHHPYHLRHYTEQDMRAMLERVGFVLVAVHSQDDDEVREDLNGRFLLFECAPGESEPQLGVHTLEEHLHSRQHEHLVRMADEITSFAKQRRENRQLLEAVADRDKQLTKSGKQLSDLQAKYQLAELEAKYARQFKASEQKLEARIKDIQQKLEAKDIQQKLEAKDIQQKLEARIKDIQQKLEARIKDIQQKLEARVERLERERTETKRQFKEVWNHPAIRRLVRLNWIGLKMLGLFGLGHPSGERDKRNQ